MITWSRTGRKKRKKTKNQNWSGHSTNSPVKNFFFQSWQYLGILSWLRRFVFQPWERFTWPWYTYMVHRIHDPELDEKITKKKSKIDQDILGIVLYFFFKVDSTLVHLYGWEGSCSSPGQGWQDLDTLTWSTRYMIQNWTKKYKNPKLIRTFQE